MKSKILSSIIPSSHLPKTAWSAFASLLVVASNVMAAAPGGPTVTVRDPVAVTVTGPVSVQGSVGVTGPVSVQGSVGVTGPVSVQGSVEVRNDALKTVFNKRVAGQIAPNFVNAIVSVPPIPSGKRLVIEAIGVSAFVAANSQATAFLKTTGIGDASNAINIPLPLTSQGMFGSINPREHYMGLHQVRVVIDPRFNNNPQIDVFRNGTFDLAEVTCTILGYLEDIPAAQ